MIEGQAKGRQMSGAARRGADEKGLSANRGRHGFRIAICPLLTQSGHYLTDADASFNQVVRVGTMPFLNLDGGSETT
jgi:hypothetical protein